MHAITTTNPQRKQRWLRLFGLEQLPVKVAVPRWQELPSRAFAQLAYDLDADRLHPMAKARFTHYVADVRGVPFEVAERMIDSWPIKAVDCQVVEIESSEEETARQRPFSVFSDRVRDQAQVFARKHQQGGVGAYG